MGKERFPRLMADPEEIRRGEQLLRVTYNKISKDQSFSKKTFNYDVYRTKRGPDARKYFSVLADRLVREHIDPSLYLKVLSKYGIYGKKGFMPPFKWMASNKGMEIFSWLLDKERDRFPRHQNWKEYLDDPGLENSRNIGGAIRRSWKVVLETMDAFNLNMGEAALVQIGGISPWFLAICTSFHRLGGLDLLEEKDQEIVIRCMRHLMKDKYSFREALREYSKT